MSAAFFYFALTAEESLGKDPFNQPAQFLSGTPVRVYSLDLPYHLVGVSPQQSLDHWVEALARNENFLDPFFDQVMRRLDQLIESGAVDPTRVAIGGLSRGAFVATHIAARDTRFKAVVGFAPLTRLTGGITFASLKGQPLTESLALHQLANQLTGRAVRYYIGNRDEQVGTAHCFHFMEELVAANLTQGIRPAPVDLIIGPSVGRYGHGTLPHTFQDGANWVMQQLLEPTS